jgi:hypothetical protein
MPLGNLVVTTWLVRAVYRLARRRHQALPDIRHSRRALCQPAVAAVSTGAPRSFGASVTVGRRTSRKCHSVALPAREQRQAPLWSRPAVMAGAAPADCRTSSNRQARLSRSGQSERRYRHARSRPLALAWFDPRQGMQPGEGPARVSSSAWLARERDRLGEVYYSFPAEAAEYLAENFF